jgi:hypothetical protein
MRGYVIRRTQPEQAHIGVTSLAAEMDSASRIQSSQNLHGAMRFPQGTTLGIFNRYVRSLRRYSRTMLIYCTKWHISSASSAVD